MKNHCGDSVVAQIYGNAPCGFYKYKYPTEVRKQKGVKGAKVRFEPNYNLSFNKNISGIYIFCQIPKREYCRGRQ